MFEFKIEKTSGNARAGELVTPHGVIKTPIFMPVGTQATVKGITREQLKEIGSEIILSNTYHLYLKPGESLVEDFGGLHKFMAIDLPILTDSGGFQVFSLGKSGTSGYKSGESLVKITEDGVHFRSHRDGSKHFFSPEKAMQIQEKLGADIIMAFDECAPGDSTHNYAKRAMTRTHHWAVRCLEEHTKLQKIRTEKGQLSQALFPIIQGVVYDDLRKESAEFLSSLDVPGIAIGGLSVGESKEDLLRVLDVVSPILPSHKPHYLMGLGTPEDLIEGIYRGMDMFDCVLPTRLGRHGVAFSSVGNIKITNQKYEFEKSGIPVDEELSTYVSRHYSMGYIRHLFHVGEFLGGQLLSLHNLEFLLNIAKKSREHILSDDFDSFRNKFWNSYPKK
ncbi:MAG: tRNA guanosine(34) transglycosylase Tgt [Candidatus Gracilibacteria bacterium]|nr:tRNA guanosine(34) transglycosylase Tgt [Candidatus Gracilibacteria bacterium]MDD2908550.1 tRNA guanosine(34) transglycosylase Tgt [Candidatus Gracilibacteria bacterium]